MSQLFDVRYTPELGRHLVARRALPAGLLVVQQEPFCSVLYDEQLPLRCDFCFRAAEGEALRRCSRSRHARYCSREHQAEAWAAGYKQECQALVAHAPRVPPPTVRLAARAMWRRLRQQSGAEPEVEHCTWDSAQALLSHWESVDDERKIVYAQMATLAREFAASGLSAPSASAASSGRSEADSLPSVQEVAQLLARFACNNHTICDEDLRPLGVGLYPLGALLNHSCRPNCMQSFGPRGRIEFRSLVNIAAGEPLTISYVELGATRQERREELAAYYFDPEPRSLPPSDAAAGSACSSTPPSPYSKSCLRPTAAICEVPFCLDEGPSSLAAPAAAQSARPKLRPHDDELGASADGCEAQLPCLLRVYQGSRGPQQTPPWPCDEHDALLTQLVVPQPSLPSAQALASHPGHGVGAVSSPIPGGVQVHLVTTQPAAGDSVGAGFMDQDDGGDVDEEGNRDCQGRGSGASAAATSGARQVVEVDCWGDWAVLAVRAAVGELAATLSSIDEEGPEEEAGPNPAACGANGVSVAALARRLGTAADLHAHAERLGSKGRRGEAVQLLCRALQLVGPGHGGGAAQGDGKVGAGGSCSLVPGLGQFHLFRMRLNAALLKAAIEEGSSWKIALKAALDLLPVYQFVYPPTWPNLGLHYATLAKLELLEGRFAEACEHARSALSILEITHSKAGGLGSRGQGVLDQVEQCASQAQASLQGFLR